MAFRSETPILTRELLLSGAVHQLREATVMLWNEAALAASLAKFLALRDDGTGSHNSTDDIWVFGYGSLVWNPAFHFAEQQLGRIYGWHRRFCLWASSGRGNPERPGLVLGLEQGGSCAGMGFRLSAGHAATELPLLWRREMISGSYHPRWITIQLADGRKVRGITFVTNRQDRHYAGALPDHEVARVLASATGCFGRCADYYFSTFYALQKLGIRDRRLHALHGPVSALCAERQSPALKTG